MPLEFLKPQPERVFRKLEEDLKHVNPKRDLAPFKAMTPRRLAEELEKLGVVRDRMIHEHTYGEWLTSPKFAELRMLQEALEMLHEHKTEREESEMLVPGFTYYRGVKQFGDSLRGQRCHYHSGTNVWGTFTENAAVAKAKTVLSFGDAEDFARIYVELADGRGDALQNITLEHITESSTESLGEIEQYCDQRWSGPWPWEMTAPYKLRTIIEDHTKMKQDIVERFHAEIRTHLRKIQEDEMDKFEIINDMRETADKIEKMIHELGRIMGEQLIILKANAQVSLGTEAGQEVTETLSEPLNNAVQSLTELLTVVKQAVATLESQVHGGGDAGMPDMGGDMGMGGEPGMPGDMGGEPDLGGAPGGMPGDAGEVDIAADMADVDLGGGDEGERVKKEM